MDQQPNITAEQKLNSEPGAKPTPGSLRIITRYIRIGWRGVPGWKGVKPFRLGASGQLVWVYLVIILKLPGVGAS